MSAVAVATITGGGFDQLRALVVDSVSSEHSRRAYARALDDFLDWYAAEPRDAFSKAVVQAYRGVLEERSLAPSTINVQLAAIRKLASEAADNGLVDPVLATGITKVRGARQLGVRMGNWLTRDQAERLLRAPNSDTIKGKRDRAILGLLIGCGLRRSEVVGLRVDDIQQREARWVIVDLAGKGKRLRTIAIPNWAMTLVSNWREAGQITEGKLFRAVDKAGRVWGSGLTEKVIWWIAVEYANEVGIERLAPHDLRRTCAKLCRASGGDLEQIQLLLGHASIQTTERYLGTRQNLTTAVNDSLGIRLDD
jgi:site-specific recombinase XerD